MNLDIQIVVKLTDGDVDDILCTALEGYMMSCWAVIDNTTEAWKRAEEDLKAKGQELYMSTVVAKVMENGGCINIEDAEGEGCENCYNEDGTPENPWKLSKSRFIRGVQLYIQHRGDIKAKLEDGTFDDVEADCLMQYAVFDDVIFG